MELWGWIAGYVALFVVLQVALYYLYVRRTEEGATPSPLEEGTTDRTRASAEGAAAGGPELSGEMIHCPHCGGSNAADRGFTYCRHCVSALRR